MIQPNPSAITPGRRLGALGLAIAGFLAAAVAAPAQWSFSAGYGVEVDQGNEFHAGPNGTFAGLPVDLQARDYDDIYDAPQAWFLQADYAMSETLTVFGRIGQVTASGSTINIGTISTLPLFGRFSDYEAWNWTAGVRYRFGTEGSFRPYVGAEVGFKDVDAITIGLIPGSATAAAAATPNLFKGGTSALVGVVAGVDLYTRGGFTLGLETGLRYEGKLKGDDAGFAGSGLESVNDTAERLVIPLLLQATFRF